MRRTDRLFELIQIVRDGRLHKASDLAEQLEVSVRTVYRDIDTLVATGIPIEGERGVGYILRAPVFLPPVTLSQVELEALHLGVALVSRSADPELQQAAQRLAAKVDSVLPEAVRPPEGGWSISVYGASEVQAGLAFMPAIRAAIREKMRLEIAYGDGDGNASKRIIRPLNLEYWGRAWTCTAWCELRENFRVFRLDRLRGLLATDTTFVDEPGKRYRDFLACEDL